MDRVKVKIWYEYCEYPYQTFENNKWHQIPNKIYKKRDWRKIVCLYAFVSRVRIMHKTTQNNSNQILNSQWIFKQFWLVLRIRAAFYPYFCKLGCIWSTSKFARVLGRSAALFHKTSTRRAQIGPFAILLWNPKKIILNR